MKIIRLERFAFTSFNLTVSIFIIAMMLLGGCRPTTALVLFSFLFSTVLTYAGSLTLRFFRSVGVKAALPTAFVTGFSVFSVTMMVLTLTLMIRAQTAFVITSALVLICGYISKTDAKGRRTNGYIDTLIACFITITIGIFSYIPVTSPLILEKTGILPIWSDYFIHGETIASFGSPFATGANMELAGESPPFYHYAPFMLPAAFQIVSGMSGLALSTSLLLPLGLLIGALGIYVFAVELSGRLGGMLAITAIMLIPSYTVFVQSGWFDFYWLLFIAPGTGYAIGVSSVICALLLNYLEYKDRRTQWLVIALLLSLIVIRVHIFMLLAPAIASMIAFVHWPKRTILLISAGTFTTVVFFFLAHYVPELHSMWTNIFRLHDYLNNALNWTQINGKPITLPQYPVITVVAQVLVVLVAVLGIYAVLLPILSYFKVRKSGFSIIDVFPYLLLIVFIGLMLFAPRAQNGDFTEYKHRHFPLLYVVLAIYVTHYGLVLAANLVGHRQLKYLVSMSVVSLFIYAAVFYQDVNPSRPNIHAMPWAEQHHNQPITPGILESANYIHTHAVKGDVAAMTGASVSGMSSNEMIEAVSLSGVPAFLTRPSLKMSSSECVRKLVTDRLKILDDLSSAGTWLDARKIMQSNGIRWLLLSNKEKSRWDSGLKEAVFRGKKVAVYDAGTPAYDIYNKPQC
jgi:hypothetical protein